MTVEAARQTVVTAGSGDRRAVAARHLYDAECALHAAHQSQVKAWIAAAGDKLHLAVEKFLAVLSEQDREHAGATLCGAGALPGAASTAPSRTSTS